VGATLFTLLSGRHVHEGNTVQEELVLAATQVAPPLQAVVPDAPSALASVIDRALRFDAKERYRDARNMHAALCAVLPTDALLTVPGTSLTPMLGSKVKSIEEDSTLAVPSSEPSETLSHAQAMTRSAPQSIAREGRNRFLLVAFGVLAAAVLIAVGRWSNEAPLSRSPASSSLPLSASLQAQERIPLVQASATRVEPVATPALPAAPAIESATPASSGRHKIKGGGIKPTASAKTPATKDVAPPNPFDLRH
jgi:serine/threonine-protein kinase